MLKKINNLKRIRDYQEGIFMIVATLLFAFVVALFTTEVRFIVGMALLVIIVYIDYRYWCIKQHILK